MENQITELFDNLTNEQVIKGIEEIKLAETTGTYANDSIVREICQKCIEISGEDNSSALFMTSIGFLKQGAYRWMDSLPKDITYDMVIEHLKTNGSKMQYGHVRVLTQDEYGKDETFVIPVFLHDSEPGTVCIGGDKGEYYEFDELIVLEIID